MSETNTSNLSKVKNPKDKYPYAIGPSGLHGIGIFASRDIGSGEKISVFCWQDKKPNSYIRDESCRFCNHKNNANSFVKRSEDGNFILYASTLIKSGEEIFVNYPDTVLHMLNYGIFELPRKVRCRTFAYINHAKDRSGHSLADELQEIREGKWK